MEQRQQTQETAVAAAAAADLTAPTTTTSPTAPTTSEGYLLVTATPAIRQYQKPTAPTPPKTATTTGEHATANKLANDDAAGAPEVAPTPRKELGAKKKR